MAPGVPLQLHGQLEEHPGQGGIVVVGQGVGGQESVDAEVLGSQLLQAGERLLHLLLGHAVLGVPRLVHDLEALLALPQGEGAAGIVAAGDGLRDTAQGVIEEVHVGQVVQVDDGPQLVGVAELLGGGLVGGEHDLMAGKSTALCHHQLGEGGAVHATALGVEQLQNAGGGGGFHGEIFLKAGIPGESLVQLLGIVFNPRLVVDVERGGIGLTNLLGLSQGEERFLHGFLSFDAADAPL